MRHVVIVGQGPSGLLAADWLSALGAAVTIVAASEGSLALWSGSFDFRNYDQDGSMVTDPWQWWAEPSHRTFAQAWELSDWKRWWTALLRSFQDIGLIVDLTLPRKNRWIVAPTGRLRPTFWCPPWQWTLSSSDPNEPVTLVDVGSLLDTPINWLKARTRDDSAWLTEAVALRRPDAWRQHWSGLAWAAFLDQPTGADWVITESIRAREHMRLPGALVFPQVLGVATTERLMQRIADAVDRPVFEYALMPPAVGGIRIRERWHKSLKSRGVLFRHGHVVEVTDSGVRLGESAGRIAADEVVIATGGIVGGGLALNTEGILTNTATGERDFFSGELNALTSVGVGNRLSHGYVVGRMVGGSDPDRHGDGGAMNVWSVATAVQAIMGERAVNSWLSTREEGPG